MVPMSFVFNIDAQSNNNCDTQNNSQFLVDCDATAYIITDKFKFTKFDVHFLANKHKIELADSSRMRGIVFGKVSAIICLMNSKCIFFDVLLEKALRISSCTQNILSVQIIARKGAQVYFGSDCNKIIFPDGTEFIIQRGKLFYVNNVSPKSLKTNYLK